MLTPIQFFINYDSKKTCFSLLLDFYVVYGYVKVLQLSFPTEQHIFSLFKVECEAVTINTFHKFLSKYGEVIFNFSYAFPRDYYVCIISILCIITFYVYELVLKTVYGSSSFPIITNNIINMVNDTTLSQNFG